MSDLPNVLKSILPDLCAGRYCFVDDLTVFGAESPEEAVDKLGGSRGEDESEVLTRLIKFADDAHCHWGRESVRERASLNPPSEFKSDALAGASPEVIQRIIEVLQKSLEKDRASHGGNRDSAGDVKAIERALSEEAIGKLPEAVARATTFDKLEYGVIPIKHLKRYFEEAHRCYLFGFNIACAVLCRAIIETALQNVIDPHGSIKSALKPKDSYLGELALEAGRGGILTDDRPKCVLAVRDAGNLAIHSYPDFERIWLPKLGEIVDHTRKILLDLYPTQA